MSMAEPHAYDPLEAGHIRLVELLQGVVDEPVVIKLIHQKIHPELKYEALSYVWGSQQRTHMVLVTRSSRSRMARFGKHVSKTFRHFMPNSVAHDEFRLLAIGKNLFVGLQHLRRADESRVLWIDAICINQDDDKEKGQEVDQMGNIYRDADCVVVWLGEESEDSKLAVSAMKKIGQDVISKLEGMNSAFQVKRGSDLDRLEGSSQKIQALHTSWVAIDRLLSRTWFSRLWVLQEIGLASDAIVVVGNAEIGWNDFRGALTWIENVAESFLSAFFDPQKILVVRPFTIHILSSSLSYMSRFAIHTHCLDPRDRIYAVLSLLNAKVASRITPNYSQPLARVYIEAVLAEMEGYPSLDLLSLCEFPAGREREREREQQQLPSWVPDFSNLPSTELLYVIGRATGYSRPEACYDPVRETLSVRGRVVDTIAYISARMPLNATLHDVIMVCRQWEPTDASTSDYIAGGLLIDAFISAISAQYSFKVSFSSAIGRSPRPDELSAEYRRFINNENYPNQTRFALLVQSFLKGKTMFRTEKGYLGICTTRIKTTDRVCIALGCETPLIIRPVAGTADHYQVGGACIVSGLEYNTGLLGLLSPGWSCIFVFRTGTLVAEFCSPTGERTQLDPRAGLMPAGFVALHATAEDGTDKEGELMHFKSTETGDILYRDPRLTSEHLKTLNIELQDIVLV